MQRFRTTTRVAAAAAVLAVAAIVGAYLAAARQTATPVASAAAEPAALPTVPVPGMVTMLDLGATECIPCKMMIPVLEDMREEYTGRAAVLFIDVWKHPDQGQRFGIQSIPTQIFYDVQGREAGRHVGFLDRDGVRTMFVKLGVR